MSSIPNAKMKHAHVQHDEDEHSDHVEKKPKADAAPVSEKKAGKGAGAKLTERAKAGAKDLGERAQDLAEDAVDAVKARPKTAAAIGAALVAGAAALVGGPAAARALKGDKKPGPKKTAEKKPAAKKAATKKA